MEYPSRICVFCCADMTDDNVVSCERNRFIRFPGGEILPSIPYYPTDILEGVRCPDCNVRIGGYHHPGCEYELCPRCGDTLSSCGCMRRGQP
ncbi:MAG: hypothetical protein JXA20_18890 [Spirochaetes bacterium]|nr:hypothetical protein [Spirochaetota bacterium]